MKTPYTKIVALGLAVTFFTGCASTEDGRLAQAQGTGLGALGGAALGALIGVATDGGDGAARGAIIGAGAGAIGGYALGTNVAYKKERYAKTEDWLDASIARATAQNRAAYAYNNSLKTQLASLESQVRAAKLANNKSKLRSLKSTIARARADGSQDSRRL